MVVGSDNFINEMLKLNHFLNIYDNKERYPEIELKKMRLEGDPDLVFLSSEPFPFKEEQVCRERARAGLLFCASYRGRPAVSQLFFCPGTALCSPLVKNVHHWLNFLHFFWSHFRPFGKIIPLASSFPKGTTKLLFLCVGSYASSQSKEFSAFLFLFLLY